MLKWAREHHCRWGEATCSYAVQGGQLDVLKWVRSAAVRGCGARLSPQLVVVAGARCVRKRRCRCRRGHLEILKGAREHQPV